MAVKTYRGTGMASAESSEASPEAGNVEGLNKKHQQNLHKLAGNQNSITSLNKACCRHLQKLARYCVESLCIRASK